MIERKKYGIAPLSASGKEKYFSGAAAFGAEARRGHGFHTRPTWPWIPHGKVTKTQLCITNKSQEVRPFPAGDHKAAIYRRKSMKTQDINNTNDPQKKYRLGAVSKSILVQVVSVKSLTNLNGHLLRPVEIGSPCFSFKRFIVVQCLLKKDQVPDHCSEFEKLQGHNIMPNILFFLNYFSFNGQYPDHRGV